MQNKHLVFEMEHCHKQRFLRVSLELTPDVMATIATIQGLRPVPLAEVRIVLGEGVVTWWTEDTEYDFPGGYEIVEDSPKEHHGVVNLAIILTPRGNYYLEGNEEGEGLCSSGYITLPEREEVMYTVECSEDVTYYNAYRVDVMAESEEEAERKVREMHTSLSLDLHEGQDFEFEHEGTTFKVYDYGLHDMPDVDYTIQHSGVKE